MARKPRKKKIPEILTDELVSVITDENKHGEVKTGTAVGNEFPQELIVIHVPDELIKVNQNIRPFLLNRYHWAAKQLENDSVVMDGNARTGYGTYILSDKPSKIFAYVKTEIEEYGCKNFLCDILTKVELTRVKNFVNYDGYQEVDHLVVFDLLEQLPDMKDYLKKILPKVKKSFIGSVPNQDVMAYVKDRNPAVVRHFTVTDIKNIFKKFGWTISQVRMQHDKDGDESQVTEKPEGFIIVFEAKPNESS